MDEATRGGRALRCAAVAVGLLVVCAACGLTGLNYSAERGAYLDALFEGDPATAYEWLCDKTQRELESPAELDMAFRAQVARLNLAGSWEPLRGESDVAYASFLRHDGDYTDLATPLDIQGDSVSMCPRSDSPLGAQPPPE